MFWSDESKIVLCALIKKKMCERKLALHINLKCSCFRWKLWQQHHVLEMLFFA